MFSCCDCPFISQDDFAGRVPIDENIRSENIEIAIRETQITYIKPIMCAALYDELCQQIKDGTLSYINQELMCYIIEVHVRYAFGFFMFIHPLRVTKESIVRKAVDESEFMDDGSVKDRSMAWKRQAELWLAELKNFMKNNIESNALYDIYNCGDCKSNNNQQNWDIF